VRLKSLRCTVNETSREPLDGGVLDDHVTDVGVATGPRIAAAMPGGPDAHDGVLAFPVEGDAADDGLVPCSVFLEGDQGAHVG